MQSQVYDELLASVLEEYKRFLHLNSEQFHLLLALTPPKIVRQDTVMSPPMPATMCLMLWFLASGKHLFCAPVLW